MVLGAYVVMELLEWARAQIMYAAGLALDRELGDRHVLGDVHREPAALAGRHHPGDERLPRPARVPESPVVLAVMEAPVALVFLVLIFAISPVLGWVAVAGALVQTFIALAQRARHAAAVGRREPQRVCRPSSTPTAPCAMRR